MNSPFVKRASASLNSPFAGTRHSNSHVAEEARERLLLESTSSNEEEEDGEEEKETCIGDTVFKVPQSATVGDNCSFDNPTAIDVDVEKSDQHDANNVGHDDINDGDNDDADQIAYVRESSTYGKRLTVMKAFIVAVTVLACLLVIFVVLYIHALRTTPLGNVFEDFKNAKPQRAIPKQVCRTRDCVIIASKIIESMDHTVDPCSDFYSYSCNGWLRSTPIPDSYSRISRFDVLGKQNRVVIKRILNELDKGKRNYTTRVLRMGPKFYKSCMDTLTIEKIGDKPIKEFIRRVGSWPVTDPDFDGKKWDAIKAMVTVHRNISSAPVFNVYVNGDFKDSTKNIISFDQSGLNVDQDTYLQNTSYHQERRDAYIQMVEATVREMGANDTGVAIMRKVFQFEKELANITMSVVERRDYGKIYETMTLGTLINITRIPELWMRRFVNMLFGMEVPLEERVASYSTKYLGDSYRLFIAQSVDVQASYVMWQALISMAPVVLGKYAEISDVFTERMSGVKERTPRWETCVDSAVITFANSLARPFVEEVYDRTAKDMSTEMIQAIKSVFTDNLNTMDWMDEKTKTYARRKAENIRDNIGYPNYILNSSLLELEFNGLEIRESEYFRNFMEIRKFNNLKNYAKRGTPVNKNEWGVLPTTVNAYYSPTENKIGFPAGILQWPFYDKRAPRAVSYGAIGMVVGHEITHGFDDQGKEFTIEGNLDSWWTNHSLNEFQRRAQCFIDQYSKMESFGKKSDGKQTLGEDLADNGGLQQSLTAYKRWVEQNGAENTLPGLEHLAPEQLFYLAFAQVWCTAYRKQSAISQLEHGVHSLSQFRVIGTLQNSVDFSKAYKCPVGSPMNPVHKCKLW